jgi:hypothetical protein
MTASGPRWRPFLVIWVLLALLSALWSLATPLGASPDEPAHLAKAASVVRGEFLGRSTPTGEIVDVPRYIAFTQAQTCFAFESEVTADCSPTLTGDPDASVTTTTSAGRYNPVYYLLVGWPSLILHDQVGIYAMRIVSGLISSLFLALAAVQLLTLRRRLVPLLAFAVAVTPMVLFLDSVVNPNSLEVTATLATFVTMFLVVRHPDPALLPARAISVVVSASIAVTMRGLSPLWVLLALAAPLLLISRPLAVELIRSTWVRTAALVIALAAAFAIAWILLSNSLGSGSGVSAGSGPTPGVGDSPLRGFVLVLFGTFDYGRGLVGVFGWLDTPAPEAVFFAWSALFGALVLVTMSVTRGRARILGLVLLLGVVLLPAVLQGIYIHTGGIIWQGRYALPIFVILVLALGLMLGEALPDLAPTTVRALALLVTATWAVAQVYSFATALRRYAVGLTGNLAAFVEAPAWSPPLGVIALILLFTAVISGAGVALAVTAVSPSNRRDLDPTAA